MSDWKTYTTADFCEAETYGDNHLHRCEYVWQHDGVDHACSVCGTHWEALG